MNQVQVSDFAKGLVFDGFLLVRMSQKRKSNNGNDYLDMTLADKSGDINAKVWDPLATAPEQGSVVKVRSAVTEYNGRLQLRVDKFRVTTPEDDVDLSFLVAAAPESPQAMRKEIDDAFAAFTNPVLQTLCKAVIGGVSDELMYYPAGQRMHHAERSGLLHHMTSMLRVANAILPCYPSLDAELVRASVLVHDLSKITEMRSDKMGNVSEYTTEGLLLGHLVVGVAALREAAQANGIALDNEYLLLLEHMVISHHGEAAFGSPRPPMFPEAELLHTLDVLDARMNEMDGILRRTPQGIFSEKIWSLDRRIYHPRYFGKEEEVFSSEALPFEQEKSDSDAAYLGLL